MAAYEAAACHLSTYRRRTGWLLPIVAGFEVGFSPLLLPPTLVATTQDVRNCVSRLLETGRHLPEWLLHPACTIVAEMAQNVCDHSGGTGCVAVCWAPAPDGPGGRLGIGVVDAGIGIPASLGPRFRERGLAAPGSEQAILAALKMADWPGRPRGTGICMSQRLLDRFSGQFHVRSGGVVLSVGATTGVLASRCPRRFADLPGTQIAIRLQV